MSRVRLYGSSKGMPFQRSTITLDEVPMPSTKRPGAAWASEPTLLGQRAGTPCVGGHDRRAEPQRRRPHRGQRQRRERVGAVGLAGPDVGVAEVGQLLEPVTLLAAAGRRRTGWSCRNDGSVIVGRASFQKRTMADWLAVASSVPSSAHRCTSAVAEAVVRRRGCGCRAAPTRSARGATIRRCCRGCCRRPSGRAPGRCRTARSRRGRPGPAPTSSSPRACGPTARERPSPGVPSSSSMGRPIGQALLEAATCHRSCSKRWRPVGALVRAGDVGHGRPLARRVSTAARPSAALTVKISPSSTWPTARAWVTLAARHRDRHVDVDDRGGPGVGQVLRRRPHDGSLGGALERLDRRAQAAAAEQEAAAGEMPGVDRAGASGRVVRRLEPEKSGRPSARP